MDVHKLNVGVKRWNDKNEIEWIRLKDNFCFNNKPFVYQVEFHYKLKVEEQDFSGTPCIMFSALNKHYAKALW